jgi:hypothetical protein
VAARQRLRRLKCGVSGMTASCSPHPTLCSTPTSPATESAVLL